jgi:hypothetical protein
VLHYAVRVKLVDENVASLVPNAEPKRREVPTFESVAELEAVAEELDLRFRPIPVLVGLTGLRPEGGSRSSGATSTSVQASSTSVACTQTAR